MIQVKKRKGYILDSSKDENYGEFESLKDFFKILGDNPYIRYIEDKDRKEIVVDYGSHSQFFVLVDTRMEDLLNVEKEN